MQPIGNPTADEMTWITHARQGDDDAFTALVETYQKPVYNFCYRMLGGLEAAEEAAQETFLRAYQHLVCYDLQRPFATWLLSIAAHHCIDRLRKGKLVSFSIDADETLEVWPPDRGAADPEEETVRRLDCEHLHRLLQSIDPIQRTALVMHYWQDASEPEIARSLQLSVAAVRSRLHRARRALARLWVDEIEAAQPLCPRKHDIPILV